MIRFINPGIQPPIYLDTANQRVGIGTATPATTSLHILKDTAAASALRIDRNGSSYVDFVVPSGTPSAFSIKANGSTSAINIFVSASGNIAVGDASINGTYFDNSGNSVAIGTNDVPVASARLELGGTTKGFLPPRVTTTEKGNISSPATGLVVYDTTLNKLCVYTGAAWETVTSV